MFASILGVFGNILLFLLVLSLVICIHELGHLFFAKRAGILCHEFAFGMGPRLWSKKIGETTYSIRAIPFGGFVSMAGEEVEAEIVKLGQKVCLVTDERGHVTKIVMNPSNPKYSGFKEITVDKIDLKGFKDNDLYINDFVVNRDAYYAFDKYEIQIAPYDRTFSAKTKWQRFMATFGGPLMNLVLAFFLYLVLAFSMGVPDLSSRTISAVSDSLPAAGLLLPGDEVLAINGVDITGWAEGDGATISTELGKVLENSTFVFTVLRDGEEITLDPISPYYSFFGLGFAADSSSTDLTILSPMYTKSPFLAGDVLVSIDGTSFTTWADVIQFQLDHPDGSSEEVPTVAVVMRDGVETTLEYVSYGTDVLDAMSYPLFDSRIGISGSNKFSLFGGIANAFNSFINASTSIYKTLGLLFSSNQVGVSDLSGFVGIYSITANAAAAGLVSLISWVALLSVNLGIVNLLPIPALDGGRLVFIAYEAISGKKPNQKVENLIHTITFFLLIALMIFITYNDILRMIGLK